MSHNFEPRTSGAARRPWPFGPPLRGRASRSAAGTQSPTSVTEPCAYLATGPFEGLFRNYRLGFVF